MIFLPVIHPHGSKCFVVQRQRRGSQLVTLENRVIELGLMVTMTFLLLAIGPFYFRWVMSMMGTS